MFASVSKRLVQKFTEDQIIESDEQELYQYGLQQGMTLLLNFITTFLIGLLLDMVWQAAVFMAAYIPLRSFAGGYHSKNPVRCYFFSTALIIAVLLTMRYLTFTDLIYNLMLLAASIAIVVFSPVADRNKPLDDMEKRVYRKRTLLIWIIEFLFTVSFLIFKLYQIAVCLDMTFLVMSSMLILGKINNKLTKSHQAD